MRYVVEQYDFGNIFNSSYLALLLAPIEDTLDHISIYGIGVFSTNYAKMNLLKGCVAWVQYEMIEGICASRVKCCKMCVQTPHHAWDQPYEPLVL